MVAAIFCEVDAEFEIPRPDSNANLNPNRETSLTMMKTKMMMLPNKGAMSIASMVATVSSSQLFQKVVHQELKRSLIV
jgi:hypothetical protein